MKLCKYADIFGKPNTGAHKYRLFNIAIVDVILTILGGYLISKYFGYKTKDTIIVLFLLGIILHRVFCVNTTINVLIFGTI
jgi:hypothetical protein